jgi:hypothetical protein
MPKVIRGIFLSLVWIGVFWQPASVIAETNVSGMINQHARWIPANSPYVISDDTIVTRETTLTIMPGVFVRFLKNCDLTVKGSLNASGVTFDGCKDVYNYEDLKIEAESNCCLTKCILTDLNLQVCSSAVEISYCLIMNHNGSGISIGGDSHPFIRWNDFKENSYYAVYVEGGTVIELSHNYWDASDGPSMAGPGTGDRINGKMNCLPFETCEINEFVRLTGMGLNTDNTQPGARITFEYEIRNFSSRDQNIVLGATVIRPPFAPINDKAHDTRLTMGPGTNSYSRSFDIPLPSPDGTYDVLWGVMDDTMSRYFGFVHLPGILQVRSK